MKYAAIFLSLGTMFSYVLGVFRDILFSRAYGASGLTDAYFSAFLVSDICLMIFVSSAILGSMTPIYVREKTKDISYGLRVFSCFYTYIPSVFLMVSIFGIIFAQPIFSFFFPHLYEIYPEDFIMLGRLFFLSNIFFSFSNVLGNFLMTEKKFISTALSPLFYNIGIIGGILLGASDFGIIAAGVGGVFGAFLHFALRLFEYYKGSLHFSYPEFSILPELKELWGTMLFRWTTVALFPLMLVGMSRFAGFYSEGLYTLFLYSRNIISAPVAIFGVAFATASFSHLSQLHASKKSDEFVEYFFETVQKVLFWTLPVGVGVFFVGTAFLEYLYHLGGNAQEHVILSTLIVFLSIAIPFESVNNVLARTLNALSMGKTLVGSNLLFLFSVFTIVFFVSYFTKNPALSMGLGYTGGFIIQVFFISLLMKKSSFFKSSFSFSEIFRSSLFALIAMSFFLWSISSFIFADSSLLLVIISAILVYTIVLLWNMKTKNVLSVLKKMM